MDANPQQVRYVFLDIVSFSYERSVEAQTDLVHYLNTIVLAALKACAIGPEQTVLLPTGDGLCVALTDVLLPFDVHVKLALEILSGLATHNSTTTDPMRQFKMRVGLNQNVDNIVTDINGRRNVAGAGINMAQRIMSVADGNQLLVGDQVHETLCVRERYMQSFRTYSVQVKHGLRIRVHQFLSDTQAGLNCDTPTHFRVPVTAPQRLTEYQAYYIALALKHRQYCADLSNMGTERWAASAAIHFLAQDLVVAKTRSEAHPAVRHAYGDQNTSFQESWKYYYRQDTWLVYEINATTRRDFVGAEDCFDVSPGGPLLFVSEHGRRRLIEERAAIAQEIGV